MSGSYFHELYLVLLMYTVTGHDVYFCYLLTES